ncbi:pyridoxal-phosphate dependent enzyme [Thermococcus sp. SY098]|uniref:pyridoxal-phosphate dependent enzyme n=1 Tax=Thermococcus sp. SY098 TaxID=3111325 RepID=UPI002D783069|nr:pyridoxal-phosphate dependent enzyme [Thermococcus sp. SY098]WRS52491.1 pyridoxal-phosphate dependent enzyme [Thermococcus sp. SY098]
MLKCQKCGKTYKKFHLVCECGGLLDVVMEFKGSFERLLKKEYLDVRRYLNFLPINERALPKLVLPIIPTVEMNIENVKVLFKLEYLMPSGSFKDRGTYVTIAKLKEEGIKEISIDSSGNAAISFALFGKAERIKVHVFIPEHTSRGKKRILKLLGAEVHEIKGSRMEVHWKAREFKDAFYISHWYNPYFLEGTKIVAYEIFEQIGDVDYALVPTGSGTLFLGLYKGFKELKDFGKAKMPKLIAVQAEGYESLCRRSEQKSKLAEGIAIPEPPRKEQMLKALKETEGFCISVGDSEIDRAFNDLISMGFLVEPTSAVVFAAFKKLLERGEFEKGSKVLLPLTGSGLKVI